MKTPKRLQLVAHGEPSDVIELNTVSEPVLGQEDVLVSMATAPLNPSDFMLVRGIYGVRPAFPFSVGAEGVGRVTQTGSKVDVALQGKRGMGIALDGKAGARGGYVARRDSARSISVSKAAQHMNAAGAGARNSSFVLLAVAMLAIGLDVGVARITYGVALPAFARDLQLSLTAAGLLGTLHLIGYLLGTLGSPSLNAKVGALALCRASHFVFACAMLVCGLTSDITTMAASRFVAGLAAGFGVFSIFLIVFDATEPEKRSAAGSLVWSGIGVAIVASGLASGPILDGGAWRLSFIVPAALALAVAVFIPRTASAAGAQPKAASASPSRLAELTSARWIFLVAAYFLFAVGYISYVTFAGVMLKGIGLSSGGVTWFWVMYGASSIAGAALGAALLSGGFARRIALSAALGSGAIGSLLVVHGENWRVFAASVLVGLGSVATPAIVTFLIRNRTSDAAYPFFFTVCTASLGLGQLSGPAIGGILADLFDPSAIGWFAAAIYGAGMLAAAADGLFDRTSNDVMIGAGVEHRGKVAVTHD